MSYSIPPGSHRIPYEEAYHMIERYQTHMDKILNPNLVDSNILPLSETFRKDAIINFLSQSEVHYFRIYLGMSPNMEIHSIIVGVDANGHDILPKPGNGPGDDPDPGIFEDALRCPTNCPPEKGCFNFKKHHH